MYNHSSVVNVEGSDEGNEDGGVGGDNCCSESTDLILDSLPDSYFKLDVFLYRS